MVGSVTERLAVNSKFMTYNGTNGTAVVDTAMQLAYRVQVASSLSLLVGIFQVCFHQSSFYIYLLPQTKYWILHTANWPFFLSQPSPRFSLPWWGLIFWQHISRCLWLVATQPLQPSKWSLHSSNTYLELNNLSLMDRSLKFMWVCIHIQYMHIWWTQTHANNVSLVSLSFEVRLYFCLWLESWCSNVWICLSSAFNTILVRLSVSVLS